MFVLGCMYRIVARVRVREGSDSRHNPPIFYSATYGTTECRWVSLLVWRWENVSGGSRRMAGPLGQGIQARGDHGSSSAEIGCNTEGRRVQH